MAAPALRVHTQQQKIQGFLHENSNSTIVTGSSRSLEGAPDVSAVADSLPPEDMDIAHLVLSDTSSRLVAACKEHIIDEYFDPANLAPNTKHREVMGVKGAKSSPLVLFRMNLWRAWLQESREWAGLAVRLTMNVLLGLIFGLLYFRQIPVRKAGRCGVMQSERGRFMHACVLW